MTAPRPIFVHGAIAGSSCWGPLTERFDGAAVLGLPGHPNGTAIRNGGELVEWIALAMAQLPGHRTIVGHGLGALLALGVARTHPELIHGVVALGAATELSVPDVAGLDHDAAVARIVASCMRDPDSDFGEAVGRAMEVIGPETLEADLALCRELNILETACDVRCPVLIVSGDQDTWASPDSAVSLARALPISHYVVVTGGRHLVHADAPATTQLLIAAFLARLELTLAEE
jgi:(E)-2-((N-methylformamido)methylene)succinate hydrolase